MSTFFERIAKVYRNSRWFRLYIKTILFIGLTIPLIAVLNSVILKDESSQKNINIITGIAAGSAALYALFSELGRKVNSTPLPYNVAIIGYPKSGKTTLIVSLFQEIFKQRIQGVKATLKGESTIERINDLIERKEKGLVVGPTNDQTMFAYRTNIEVGKGFSLQEYKVEFGDYPGEFSEKVVNSEYFNIFRKSEFFKWCSEADAFIFIIDVGKYILSQNKKEFVAEMSKLIRQSLQHFMDNNYLRAKDKKLGPTLLIFNKMDLANYYWSDDWGTIIPDYNQNIHKFAYSEDKNPPIRSLSEEKYFKLSNILEDTFRDLIVYMKSECKQFNILFTSSFGLVKDELPDIQKVLKFILPRDFF